LAELIGLDKENNLLSDMGIMMMIGVGIVLVFIVLLVVGHFAMNYSYEFYRKYR
jgi:alpha-N-acetylglucosamine transferase